MFVGYIAAIGRLPGIHRTFEYHGAEHQAIAAAAQGDELTVERVAPTAPAPPAAGPTSSCSWPWWRPSPSPWWRPTRGCSWP
ncbi:MAG: DUF1385 domain-containing protein [Acidimicrobiales bacterium]